MGATQVMVTIRNPAAPERHWTGRFLVDTGAFDSLVPRRHLEEIGLQPLARETYVLADGCPIDVDTTVGRIEFMGKIVGGTLVFGDGDAEPLLGATALESGGFEVDPRTRQLKRLPAVLLKGKKPAAKAPLHSSGDASRVDCVAPRSNMPNMLPRRALPRGRLAALGATRRFATDSLRKPVDSTQSPRQNARL